MTERLNTTRPEDKNNGQPSFDFEQYASEFREKEGERAREDVQYWSDEYTTTEAQFANYKVLSRADYEVWEADAAESFKKMKEAEYRAEYKDRYERDAAEKLARVDPRKSIEAASGYYYTARNEALIQAIQGCEDEDKREKDLEIVYGLHALVARHIQASQDYELRRTDIDVYQANRRHAHNNLISGLNAINDLAEAYGVTRLTFRNFETNDFIYHRELDSSGQTDARCEYDRSCVEEWAKNAFSREFDQAAKESSTTSGNSGSLVARFHSGF